MIHESAPITNSFVSVPADMGHFNCAAFLAGIIAGVLDSAKFVSVQVVLCVVAGKNACSGIKCDISDVVFFVILTRLFKVL